MNERLQKKCFFAATGFHLLLLTILIIGPAFLMAERKADDAPMLDFVPTTTIDEAFSNRGSSGAPPPAPQPPQPEVQPPAPEPTPVRQPDPPKVVVKEPEPEALEPTPPKLCKPEVSLRPVVRRPNATTVKPPTAATDDADARALARANERRTMAVRSALRNIGAGLSSSTTVTLPPGDGGSGGPSYANFLQALRKVYTDAWLLPDGITDDEATVTTSVTIARNGDVVATKILRSSGNAAVDASVDAMLRRVTHAVPLPDSAKENQRTVTIKFNVKAKLNG